MFGIPESELAQSLREIGASVDLTPLEITTCLRRGELEVEIRHRAGAEREREQLIEGLVERHERFVFSRDGSTIDEQLAALLRGRRLGLAESCTGGLLAARLTERPGASEYVAGGVVSYSDRVEDGAARGPDRADRAPRRGLAPVARAMADGALARFEADVAVRDHRGRRARRRQRGEAGRLRLLVASVDADGAELARDIVVPGDRGRDPRPLDHGRDAAPAPAAARRGPADLSRKQDRVGLHLQLVEGSWHAEPRPRRACRSRRVRGRWLGELRLAEASPKHKSPLR